MFGASLIPKARRMDDTKALPGVETPGALLFLSTNCGREGRSVSFPSWASEYFRRPSHGSLVVPVDLPDGPQRYLAGIHDPP